MKHNVVFTSDLHGNLVQYQKLVEYVAEIKPDTVIIGGDIAPKGFTKHEYIQSQRSFLKKVLPKFLRQMKKASSTRILLMMGNDDCAVNSDVLNAKSKGIYEVIQERRIALEDGFEVVGYPYVPLTHVTVKDWEKCDFSEVPPSCLEMQDSRNRTGVEEFGWKSRVQGILWKKYTWQKVDFTEGSQRNESIQKDLSLELYRRNPRKTILVAHAPPYDTNLDISVKYGDIFDWLLPDPNQGEPVQCHVGSIAELLYIQEVQPYLTLHGHIHGSVRRSGYFVHRIGETTCMASGNTNKSENLAVLVFDLYDLSNAERRII